MLTEHAAKKHSALTHRQTWNTGPLMSDSSGYIALSHPDSLHGKDGRIIVAFRGTYSIANTIADLSTVPQEYVPYPGDDDEGDAPEEAETPTTAGGYLKSLLSHRWSTRSVVQKPPKCEQCEVHMGFYRAWRNTRDEIMPYLDSTIAAYPKYELTIVGHSLGGAVAALAALDFETHGWHPTITTFGEPRIGNAALAAYVDDRFGLNEVSRKSRFRRITHIADPVPMLPLDEWGYKPHSGEIFVSAVTLPPAISDMRLCSGSEDPDCLAGHEGQIPTRYKLWELFFAHRDYFHRIGLCVPGGDPSSGLRPPAVD